MEKTAAHGKGGRLSGTGLDVPRRRGQMAQGLGNSPKNQSDAHSGGEKHAEPSEIAVLRLFMIQPQFQIPEPAHSHAYGKDQKKERGQQICPAEIVDYPQMNDPGHLVQNPGRKDAHSYNAQGYGQGEDKDRVFSYKCRHDYFVLGIISTEQLARL